MTRSGWMSRFTNGSWRLLFSSLVMASLAAWGAYVALVLGTTVFAVIYRGWGMPTVRVVPYFLAMLLMLLPLVAAVVVGTVLPAHACLASIRIQPRWAYALAGSILGATLSGYLFWTACLSLDISGRCAEDSWVPLMGAAFIPFFGALVFKVALDRRSSDEQILWKERA